MDSLTRPFSLLRAAALSALAVTGPALSGCEIGSTLPPDETPAAPDAGEETPNPDAAVEAAANLSGSVRDWANLGPLGGVTLQTDGLTPQLTAISDAQGAYAFEQVTPNIVFTVTGVYAAYRTTVSPRLQYAGVPMVYPIDVVSNAEVERQHAAVAVQIELGTAFVVAELLKGDGSPRDGVLLQDVTLTNAGGTPVGEGPYFFGPDGLISGDVLASTVVGGKAQVAFLNVPAGAYTLTALYPQDNDGQNGGGGGGGGGNTKTATVLSLPDAAVLLRVNERL